MSNRLPRMVKQALIFCLGLSALSLGLYLFGGGFSDDALLLLLRVLRYLSFLVFLLSLCAVVFSIRKMIAKPRPLHILGIALYIFSGAAGAAIVIISAFMVAASGGNG